MAEQPHKAYYSGLTDILRRYLADRYGIGAMEMTSDEIIDAVRPLDLPRKSALELAALLREADLVKFAKATPEAARNEEAYQWAYYFVEETKPVEEQPSAEAEDPLGRRLTTTAMRRIFLFLALALLAVDAAAQQYPERRQVRKGNRAYDKGNYQDAAGRYMRALGTDPASFEARYDLGNAFHRQELYDQAAQAQQQAAADSLAGARRSRRSVLQSGQHAVPAAEIRRSARKLQKLAAAESRRPAGEVQLRLCQETARRSAAESGQSG